MFNVFIGLLYSFPVVSVSDFVASWHFDEGKGTIAADSSGNSNDGTLSGPIWTTGISGSALQFDGVDDYMNVSHNDSLNVSNITISAWIKLDAFYANLWGPIVRKSGQYNLYIENSPAGRIYFKICNTTVCNQFNSGVNILSDVWTYVIATYNGNIAKIFFNGVEKK